MLNIYSRLVKDENTRTEALVDLLERVLDNDAGLFGATTREYAQFMTCLMTIAASAMGCRTGHVVLWSKRWNSGMRSLEEMVEFQMALPARTNATENCSLSANPAADAQLGWGAAIQVATR